MKTTKKWVTFVMVAAGSTMFASNCATSMRDAAIGAGADFVGDTTAQVLTTFVPADLFGLLADEE